MSPSSICGAGHVGCRRTASSSTLAAASYCRLKERNRPTTYHGMALPGESASHSAIAASNAASS